jgi:hypothetical protein
MPLQVPEDFDKNVFINCPFDSEYLSLLRPLLFTIIYVGLNPKIALETSDSGEVRITKICELIRSSMYSIHDLSRLQSRKKHEFYRLNMPFELGIEYGCRQFASNHLGKKRCLILEKTRHDYLKALSDLSGVDIKSHGNKEPALIRAVRSWFIETVGLRALDSATVMWYRFTDFMSDFYEKRASQGFSDQDLEEMPVAEFIHFIREWLQVQATISTTKQA